MNFRKVLGTYRPFKIHKFDSSLYLLSVPRTFFIHINYCNSLLYMSTKPGFIGNEENVSHTKLSTKNSDMNKPECDSRCLLKSFKGEDCKQADLMANISQIVNKCTSLKLVDLNFLRHLLNKWTSPSNKHNFYLFGKWIVSSRTQKLDHFVAIFFHGDNLFPFKRTLFWDNIFFLIFIYIYILILKLTQKVKTQKSISSHSSFTTLRLI